MNEIQEKMCKGLMKLCTGFSICNYSNEVALFCGVANIIIKQNGEIFVECSEYCKSESFLRVAKVVALAEEILKENTNV